MVFEYGRLLPFLTVADNMAFGLTVRHTPKQEVAHRVEEQARGLRLTRLLGRKPGSPVRGRERASGHRSGVDAQAVGFLARRAARASRRRRTDTDATADRGHRALAGRDDDLRHA